MANDNGFRFYAAAPLATANGFNLGTMCLIDFKPREFDPDERTLLESLARMVMVQMEQRLASRQIASLARDIEEKNSRLALLASHDGLTGLKNRTAIETLLDTALASRTGQATLAVMLIDVDLFKNINDTYGHQAGDIVLREVSARLKGAIREQDEIGRFGGEEFLVVAPKISFEDATYLAERVRCAVCSDPLDIGGIEISVSVSIGLCVSSGERDAMACIRLSDEALYASKSAGRNRVTAL